MSNDYSELIARLDAEILHTVKVDILHQGVRDALTAQAREIEALRAVIRETRQALEAASCADGAISDTIWMPGRPETLFDFLDAAMQAGKAVTP